MCSDFIFLQVGKTQTYMKGKRMQKGRRLGGTDTKPNRTSQRLFDIHAVVGRSARRDGFSK